MFFLGLVLVMSSGLTIYSRSCDEGCEKEISLNKEDVDCKSEKNEEEEKSCCQKEVETKSCCAVDEHEHENDDCCSTEAFSLDADFYGSVYVLNIDFLQFDNNYTFDFTQVDFSRVEKNQFTNLPLPDLGTSGKYIILKKNSFLI